MIEILPRGGAPVIMLTPRQGFKRTHQALEFPMVYGHRCPTCSNVIQAVFLTDQKVDLFPYEQTSILTQSKDEEKQGEVRAILPDTNSEEGYSCYHIDFTNTVAGGSQKIVLRNHVLKLRALVEREPNGEGLFEKGDRYYVKACTKIGIHALRDDLLMKDYCLFANMSDVELRNYNLPPVSEVITEFSGSSLGRLVPTIGQAPPLVLLERSDVVHGYGHVLRPVLKNYLKNAAINTA